MATAETLAREAEAPGGPVCARKTESGRVLLERRCFSASARERPMPYSRAITFVVPVGRSAIGVDSRLRKKIQAMCGQKGRASAMRRR